MLESTLRVLIVLYYSPQENLLISKTTCSKLWNTGNWRCSFVTN